MDDCCPTSRLPLLPLTHMTKIRACRQELESNLRSPSHHNSNCAGTQASIRTLPHNSSASCHHCQACGVGSFTYKIAGGCLGIFNDAYSIFFVPAEAGAEVAQEPPHGSKVTHFALWARMSSMIQTEVSNATDASPHRRKKHAQSTSRLRPICKSGTNGMS